MAPKVSYEANFSGTEVVIYRSVHAGVCGPDRTMKVEHGTTFTPAELDEMLTKLGYTRTGEWTVRVGYSGLEMSCVVLLAVDAVREAKVAAFVQHVYAEKNAGRLTSQEAANLITSVIE